MSESVWTPFIELDEIAIGGSCLIKHAGHRIAVFRTGESECFAIDNLCPHEGYPLLGGPVRDCVVTCPWHNYKFRLDDGQCVKGEEDVRSWPLRIVEGRIEIDLADPDPAAVFAGLERSLVDGMWRANLGQVARDLLRWLEAGGTSSGLALLCARFDARHAEWGTTHALPVAVDGLRWSDRRSGADRVLPLLYAFEMAADEQRRRPVRPESPALDALPGDFADCRLRLMELVEEERAEDAEALLRAMLQGGIGAPELEALFYELCAEHFIGFGHPLIYATKAFDLLERVGFEHAEEILPALLLRILRSTRESLLPEWSRWRADMHRMSSDRGAVWSRVAKGQQENTARLAELVVDGDSEEVHAELSRLLESSCEPGAIIDVLSHAAAIRLLRFDTAIEEDPGVQEGWLHVTHRFTFVNAIRNCAARRPGPWLLPLMFQAAHWVNAGRPLDEAEPAWADGIEQGADLDEVMDALAKGDRAGALARVRGFLAASDDAGLGDLQARLEELVLSGPVVRPIVSTHLIKTLTAAFEEARALPGEAASAPIQAFLRLLTSPLVENVLPRRVHEAIGFVLHGRVPKTLT